MSDKPRARVLILAPFPPEYGFGGAERHLHDLIQVLSPICKSVIVRSRDDAPPPGWCAKILTRFEPMLISPLAAWRLVRQGLPDADVVLSIELMGFGVKHSGHLHLFFGCYTGYRSMALPPAHHARSLIRGIKSRVARALEIHTQGKLRSIANSIGLRDVIRGHNIPVRDVFVPPPTDCTRFKPGDKQEARANLGLPQDRKIILFAGRWEYSKGADRCTRFLEVLPEDWQVLIVTPSGYTWPIPYGPNVSVLNDLGTEQMIAAYRAADVLVQPSRFEGYSLVASEAQACGCPVLVSPVGQAEHFLSFDDPLIQAAVIDDPDEPNQWLAALDKILASDVSQARHGSSHRSYAEARVSFPAVQNAWIDVLLDIYEDYSWQPH